MFSQVFTYYLAGIVAQFLLGASEFYPPSPNAIVYLKDPHVNSLQILIFSAQLLRGFLFGLILMPLLPQIIKLGKWRGSVLIGGIILIIGYIAASGGLIEHFVFFKPEHYPIQFALITLEEITIQTLILSTIFALFFKKEFEQVSQ